MTKKNNYPLEEYKDVVTYILSSDDSVCDDNWLETSDIFDIELKKQFNFGSNVNKAARRIENYYKKRYLKTTNGKY